MSNQILVEDKIYVTPEIKRKKIMYKIYFIISVFLLVYLFSYYIYAEYDKSKSEEVSKTLIVDSPNTSQDEIPDSIKTDDNVLIIVLDEEDTKEDEFIEPVQEVKSNDIYEEVNIDTTVHTAKDGTDYKTVAIINIPKINVNYPIIAPLNKNLLDYTAILKISPCRYYGPEPNEIGNYCIVGHNYRNQKFFSKVPNLENGDIVELTDTSGRKVIYKVYKKYIVNPDNKECTNQDTNGIREITLITCTNDSTQRYIIKCIEEKYYIN